MAEVQDSLSAFLGLLQQGKRSKQDAYLNQSRAYQAQAGGDLDIAKANDLTKLQRAFRDIGTSIQTNGLEATMGDVDLMSVLAGASGNVSGGAVIPGMTDASKLNFALADKVQVDKNNAFSIPGQDRIRGEDAALTQANDLAKIFATPKTTGAGAITEYAPGDPRGGPDGLTYGRTTDSVAKGGIRSEIASGARPASDMSLLGTGNKGLQIRQGEHGLEISFGGGDGLTTQLDNTGMRNAVAASQQMQDYQALSAQVRTIAESDPRIFGTIGNVRRTVQDIQGQTAALSQMFGGDFGSLYSTAQADLIRAGIEPEAFDPNLPLIDKASILLAYKGAAALAGQSGRDLSNKDFDMIRKVIGNPTSWGSNQQSFVSGLDFVDTLVQGSLERTNSQINAGVDTSAGGTVMIDGEQYTLTGRYENGKPIVRDAAGNEFVDEGE